MSILCPHCNFEIALVGVRPGRFSPKCQSCSQTFTLYVAKGAEKYPMAAMSHLELHEMCLRMGKQPPRPYPAGVSARAPKVGVAARDLVGVSSTPVTPSAPQDTPAKAAIIFDLLGETDTVAAINDEIVEKPRPCLPQKKKAGRLKVRSTAKITRAAAAPATMRRLWTQFKRKHLLWGLRRFGTPLDWLFAPFLRIALSLMILAGFGMWWMQNKGEQALQQAVQTVVATTSGQQQAGTKVLNSGQQTARNRPNASNSIASSKIVIMTSHTLDASWLSDPVRRALSGWNACLAGILIFASAFSRGRLFAVAILIAAAIAMMAQWYHFPQIGQPLPWMTASAAGALAMYAFIVLRRPADV